MHGWDTGKIPNKRWQNADAALDSLAALTLAQGDVLYATAADTLANLAKNASSTRYLSNTGTSNNPAWAQVALATGVSGVLPTANGGTSVDIASAALPLGSGQITFPATQNASATANVLDDYEEGTWTPTIQDASLSDSESQAYTTQVGRYVKIGKICYLYCTLTTSSIGTLTGTQSVRIAGLPFTSTSTADGVGGVYGITANGLAIAAAYGISGFVPVSVTHVRMVQWNATTGSSDVTITEWSADGKWYFAGFYETTG